MCEGLIYYFDAVSSFQKGNYAKAISEIILSLYNLTFSKLAGAAKGSKVDIIVKEYAEELGKKIENYMVGKSGQEIANNILSAIKKNADKIIEEGKNHIRNNLLKK